MKRAFALAALTASLWSTAAHALFEARLTYGGLASNPDLSKLYSGTTSAPTIVPNYGVGADALFFFPLTSWGVGVRYENLGLSVSGSGLDFKSKANRTAVVVAYRLIDTLLHVGPIFTYGLSHTNSMDVTDSNTSLDYAWAPDSSSSYSLGLEAGVGLGLFNVGGELGYQNMMWNKMKDSKNSSSSTPDIDMSGTYLKLFVGIGI